ncbi:hypothetical protein GCM10009555_007630 [Acrocarpospora macrocephala]|uniref:VWFA domain-containing protein n=1 Tax=Acrocarpospora macrocephala TaxID=150177 RepID=A0A5M3WYI7_9ACTN|nr:VWA domain-containing protein [Acrocarpospora macrocephala]GES12969.1 hypothetical protein Amac_065660 [Acrocarpospora macrocephala]
MAQFAETESHPVFPVYLLIDVSYSMAGAPIAAVNASLPGLKHVIDEDPMVGELARVCILSFAEDARIELPLADLQYAELPRLESRGNTNFAAAFALARTEIEAGIRALGTGTRFYRPVVFFMSDGMHNAVEDWRDPLRALIDRNWPFFPEIVAFGFGDADAEALGTIASRYAFRANGEDTAAQVQEIMSTLVRSIQRTSGSMGSGGQGELVVDVEPSKYTPLPILEVK